MNIRYPANDTNPLCDFCCARETPVVVALLVDTRVFYLERDPVRRVSEGEWYACRECLKLIIAKNRRGLAQRYLEGRPWPFRIRSYAEQDLMRIQAQALDQLEDWPT
jgi:hypothetical protein